MSNEYKIYGAEMSPYSVKVRSFFRYKQVPHQWISRSMDTMEDYQKIAKIPIIPAVATPDGGAMQDSTPIMEKMDGLFPDPSVHPDDAALQFLSYLLEEFGDEWGNKLMFHFRWWDEADQKASARVLARSMMPDGDDATIQNVENAVLDRMSGRGGFVGSSAETAPLIAGYLDELLDVLDPHLASRKYLFGDRPSFGDFGLFAQLYEAYLDPTAGGIIRARAHNVMDWCLRMIDPRNDGDFEGWDSLQATLQPVIALCGSHFLPWSAANAKALMAGEESFTVNLDGEDYTQGPQKYHAKSLAALREKYTAVDDKSALDPILQATGCLAFLQEN